MKYQAIRRGLVIGIAGLLVLPAVLSAQQGFSHTRIVRLSYVSGAVAIKRPGSSEWAKALVNTPIQEGFGVSTSTASYAEVEFENGSTARLGELSQVNFDQLAMDAAGNKLNRLTFQQGYATFHFMPEHQDAYSVKIADATLTPSGKSEFRTDLRQGRVRVEVFNGSVTVAAPSASEKLGKDKVLEYNTGTGPVAASVHQGIEKDDWDKWADARDTQEQLALRDQAVPARGPLYGWSDLDAYGEWANVPGYGYGWAPYAPMGWSPYGMGMWDMYPGFGMTYISAEPWGWLPYHYGMWNFDPTFGWFWMPGSFGFWSPALVNWYSGPGWVGWAPQGVLSQSGVLPLTTVPGNAIRTGQMITAQDVNHVRVAEGKLVKSPQVEPGLRATLPEVRLGAGGETSLRESSAPATVLMGGDPEAEKSLLAAHESAFARALGWSPAQPLRARLGATLGGKFAVAGPVGEFRGDASMGAPKAGAAKVTNGSEASELMHGSRRAGITLLPHGQSAASPHPSDGGGLAPASGGTGGNSGPTTASSPSAPSSGHSATSGGGHH